MEKRDELQAAADLKVAMLLTRERIAVGVNGVLKQAQMNVDRRSKAAMEKSRIAEHRRHKQIARLV